MANKHRILFILWGLSIGWLLLALFLSSQTGEETCELSMSISGFVADLFRIDANDIPLINTVLRKIAHILVFFTLSALFSVATDYTFPKHRLAMLWPMPPCVALAVIDEIRKAAIPGRHCSWSEAGLNVLGCVLGTVVMLGCIEVCKIKKQKLSSYRKNT